MCNQHRCFHFEICCGPSLIVPAFAVRRPRRSPTPPSTTKVRNGAQQRNATLTSHPHGDNPHLLGNLLDHGREPQLLPLSPHVPHRPRLEPHHLLSSLARLSWDVDLPCHRLFLIGAFPSPIDTSAENMAHHSFNEILRLVHVECLHRISITFRTVFSIPLSPYSSPHEMPTQEVEPSSLQPHTRRAPATTSKGSQLATCPCFLSHARSPTTTIQNSALFQPSYHRAVYSKASGARQSSFSSSDGHQRASTRGSRCLWRQSRLVGRICFLSKHVNTRNLHLEGKHQQHSAWARRAFCPLHDKVAPDRLTWSSKSVAADPRARVARSKSHVLQDVKTSMWLPADSRQHDGDTRRLFRLCRARWLLAAHAKMECSRCVAALNADRAVPRIVSTCKNYLVIFRSSRVLDGVS